MLGIKKTKKLLGDKGKDFSDEEVEKIRDEFYMLGNIIFEKWLVEKQAKKKNKNK